MVLGSFISVLLIGEIAAARAVVLQNLGPGPLVGLTRRSYQRHADDSRNRRIAVGRPQPSHAVRSTRRQADASAPGPW